MTRKTQKFRYKSHVQRHSRASQGSVELEIARRDAAAGDTQLRRFIIAGKIVSHGNNVDMMTEWPGCK